MNSTKLIGQLDKVGTIANLIVVVITTVVWFPASSINPSQDERQSLCLDGHHQRDGVADRLCILDGVF